MGQLLKLISEHSTAINAITAAGPALVAVVGIFLTCFSIWSTNEGNRIANEQFQYERAKNHEEEERSQAVLVSAWINPNGPFAVWCG